MPSTLLVFTAAALLSSAESAAPAANVDTDVRTPHRISLAIGTGAALHDVDLDGHGRSGGNAEGIRLGYDHAVNRWFDLGAGFAYLAVDARAQHAFMPTVRARAHIGTERVEAGLSLKLMGLVGLMTDAAVYESDGRISRADNTWIGVGAATALDLRVWVGDTAFEVSPEVAIGSASGTVRGYYVSDQLTHLSAIVWFGALRRF
jgi:hypothetical protein